MSVRSNMYRYAAVAVAALGLAAGVQARERILIDQTRTVSAQASAGDAEQQDHDSSFDQALDFGLFASTVYANANVQYCGSSSHAAQTSEWIGNQLLAAGDVFAQTHADPMNPSGGSAEAESFLEFTFELTEAAEFSLTGELRSMLGRGESSSSRLALVGPYGTIIDMRADPRHSQQVMIDEAGAMDAGVYTLTATSSIFVASNEVNPNNMGLSSYEFALAVPAPCRTDVDGSGAADIADILAILAAWGAAGGPEDVDGNGTVGFGDILAVLAAWGPCP